MSYQRLRQTNAVRAVFAARASARSDVLSVHVRTRPGKQTRATVVAGKKVGRAVERNRAKRRLRAALRAAQPQSGIDIVLVAQPAVLASDFAALTAQVQTLTRRALDRAQRCRS